MRPKKHVSFGIYKHSNKDGPSVWFVRFWDETTRHYAMTRSTGVLVEGKREHRDEAMSAARAMLPEIRFAPPIPERLFVNYVENFWTPESHYVRERALVLKRPLSAYYIKMNHDDVERHLRPFPGFKRLAIKDFKTGQIRDWMTW
ncbi:MAG: hypothetical protein NT061_04380, partial [Spirochaetes bacterium]|nr:hypothetical protein [Spirochaetota bacterium]